MTSRKRQRLEELASNGDAIHDHPGDRGSDQRRQKQDASLVKRFRCNYEGCGKVYSRAEHLERHTLNRP